MIKHISSRKDCKTVPSYRKDPTISPQNFDGLVVWEPFDQPRLKTLVGDMAMSYNGTYGTNYVRPFADVMGIRSVFGRSEQSVPYQSNSSSNFSKPFPEGFPFGSSDRTMSLWFYPECHHSRTGSEATYSGGFGYGVGKRVHGPSSVDYYDTTIVISEGDVCKSSLILSAGDISGNVMSLRADNLDITPGRWYHIAVTSDAAGSKVYLNGTKVAEDSTTLSTNMNTSGDGHMYIFTNDDQRGGVNYWHDFKNSAVSEFCVYSRALSETEIASLAKQIITTTMGVPCDKQSHGISTLGTPIDYSTKKSAKLSNIFIDRATLACIDGSCSMTELVHSIEPVTEGSPTVSDGVISTPSNSTVKYDFSKCYDMDRFFDGDLTIEWSERMGAFRKANDMFWSAVRLNATQKSSWYNGDFWNTYYMELDTNYAKGKRLGFALATSKDITYTIDNWPVIYDNEIEDESESLKAYWFNNWHHIALCRQGRLMQLFIDGRLALRDVDAELMIADFSDSCGCSYSQLVLGGKYAGAIQRFRVSNVCRYSDNFTPPDGWKYTEQPVWK